MAFSKFARMNLFKKEEDLMVLPKGFRFHPTDPEIITHYLIPKAMNSNFTTPAISHADFNKSEPWDLPKIANMGESERYYYFQRDRKYPTGMRTNRATKVGYWKATGKDKEIYNGHDQRKKLIGMKKTLVFYTGRAPRGEKTNWVMHEYRLQPQFHNHTSKSDEWVVSRVFLKNAPGGGGGADAGGSGGGSISSDMDKKTHSSNNNVLSPTCSHGSESFPNNFIRDDFDSLPPLLDPSATPPPRNAPRQLQDTKQKSVAIEPPPFNFFQEQSQPSFVDAYDDQLIYVKNLYFSAPSLAEPLFVQALPEPYVKQKGKNVLGMEDLYNCKVEQQCTSLAPISQLELSSNDMSDNDNNFDISSNGQENIGSFLPSMGSMIELSDLELIQMMEDY